MRKCSGSKRHWASISSIAQGIAPVADGMIVAEMARGDGSFSTLHGVHSGLAAGSAIYLVILALFGAVESPATAVLAVPASTLCGLAFAAPIAAFSSTQENDQWFTAGFRVVIPPTVADAGAYGEEPGSGRLATAIVKDGDGNPVQLDQRLATKGSSTPNA